MKIRISTIFLLSLLLIGMNLSRASSQVKVQDTSETSISVAILFANYTDLDEDGYMDDVYAEVSIDLYGGVAYTFEYYVTLTLPSGLNFSYLFIISTNYQSFTIYNFFYDHATESGWYTLNIDATLNNGGRSTATSTLIFDPPGGSGGSDPDLEIST
ncbi:MAG: hypothetical protein D6732_11010 [Methanobacteriota archaeon]|nr:MAG: hypothetical protein D6732_11010 [Euryarchaeota archaeon]